MGKKNWIEFDNQQ